MAVFKKEPRLCFVFVDLCFLNSTSVCENHGEQVVGSSQLWLGFMSSGLKCANFRRRSRRPGYASLRFFYTSSTWVCSPETHPSRCSARVGGVL